MNQIAITDFRHLKVAELPDEVELTSDGRTLGYFVKELKPVKGKTKCPNCKLEYTVTPPDGKPPFFTMRHA